jgi:hypothetical protein
MVAEALVMAYLLPMFNKNLIKIIKAIDLLATPGGTTVEALQNKLELSRRSVFRLIETMTSELGLPMLAGSIFSESKRLPLSSYKVIGWMMLFPRLTSLGTRLVRLYVFAFMVKIGRGWKRKPGRIGVK